MLFRRNCAVKNTVDKAGNSRHGRAQIVGDICKECAPHILQILQGGRHIVERLCKFRNLVSAHNGDSRVKLTVRKGFCRTAHIPDGGNETLGGKVYHYKGSQHYPQRRHNNGAVHGAHKPVYARISRRGKYRARINSVIIQGNGVVYVLRFEKAVHIVGGANMRPGRQSVMGGVGNKKSSRAVGGSLTCNADPASAAVMYNLPVLIHNENKHIVIVDGKQLKHGFQPLRVSKKVILKAFVIVAVIVFDIYRGRVCRV